MKDIQLDKDLEVDKIIPIITCQVNYKDEDFEENLEELKQQTKDKDDQ